MPGKLTEAGADVNTRIYEGYETALTMASQNGHHQCVEILVKAGADTNVQGITGNTALMYAVQHNHPDCALILIKAGN